jgi:ABC-type multidrug transport system ATPase subunit
MMKISVSDAAKRFNREWIFHHFNYTFSQGVSYAITGPNGSGKSTLLQVIAGATVASNGKIVYQINDYLLPPDTAFRYISLAAPYLELIEEMTATEFLQFHSMFKPLQSSKRIQDLLITVGLREARDKQIRYFSSGMKQRLKLVQAIFSETPCVLLDEPCTNLDEQGVQLYQDLIREYCSGRLVIVSSNDEKEFSFCKERINILDYK